MKHIQVPIQNIILQVSKAQNSQLKQIAVFIFPIN